MHAYNHINTDIQQLISLFVDLSMITRLRKVVKQTISQITGTVQTADGLTERIARPQAHGTVQGQGE